MRFSVLRSGLHPQRILQKNPLTVNLGAEKFRTLRSKFKHTVRTNTKDYKNSLRKQIENSVNDQKLFWGARIKIPRESLIEINIQAKLWYDYCNRLLNGKPNNVSLSFDKLMQDYLATLDKNCSICSGMDSSQYPDLLELNENFIQTQRSWSR